MFLYFLDLTCFLLRALAPSITIIPPISANHPVCSDVDLVPYPLR
jgi:hypothetical protein